MASGGAAGLGKVLQSILGGLQGLGGGQTAAVGRAPATPVAVPAGQPTPANVPKAQLAPQHPMVARVGAIVPPTTAGTPAGQPTAAAPAASASPSILSQLGKLLSGSKQSVMQHLGTIKESISGAASQAHKAVTSERLGDIGSGAFGAGQKLTGLVGGPADWMMKLGKAFSESLEKLRKWTDQLHESNLQFSEFSAGMAGVSARSQIREMMLSQERGDRRAATAEYLSEGRAQLNRAVAPTEDLAANLKNIVVGAIDKLLAGFIDKINPTIESINAELKKFFGDNDGPNPLADQMSRAGAGNVFLEEFGRPGRWSRRFPI